MGGRFGVFAAGEGTQPDWDSQCDRCQFPAQRGGLGVQRWDRTPVRPLPSPGQRVGGGRGGPWGAGWAPCPGRRGPVISPLRHAGLPPAVGQAGGAGEAPQLQGPGSVGGTLCTPTRLGASRGTQSGRAGVCTPTCAQLCSHAHVRTCTAGTWAAWAHPTEWAGGPSLHMGCAARTVGAPLDPPCTSTAAGLQARAPTAHTRVHIGHVLCVHTRVQGPRDTCGAEGGFGERCGAGGALWGRAGRGQPGGGVRHSLQRLLFYLVQSQFLECF